MSTDNAPEVATAPEIPTPTLPKDLQAQMATIAGFGTVHAVLHKSSYPAQVFQAATDSIGFIKECFEAAVEKALKHPKADLVPQLKELKEKAKAEKKAQLKATKAEKSEA